MNRKISIKKNIHYKLIFICFSAILLWSPVSLDAVENILDFDFKGLYRQSSISLIDVVNYEIIRKWRNRPEKAPVISQRQKSLFVPQISLLMRQGKKWGEVFEEFKMLALSMSAKADRNTLRSCYEKGFDYIGQRDKTLFEPISENKSIRRDVRITAGYAPTVKATETVLFKNLDKYVYARLKPLNGILDQLGNKDVIAFSNLDSRQTLAELGYSKNALKLNLPLLSYGKEILMVGIPGGGNCLVLCDFPGKVYLRHFQLILKHYFRKRLLRPRLLTLEDDRIYEMNYKLTADQLSAVMKKENNIEVLVVGYSENFRDSWKTNFISRSSLEGNPWTVDFFQLNPGKTVAVISCSDSYHGEILGKTLALVSRDLPELKAVICSGSAGSLHPRPIYSIVYPAFIRYPSGGAVQNALTSASDGLAHYTVLSPLVETKSFLDGLMKSQVTTVDMEMGYVAENFRGTGIQTGVALLCTDFPYNRAVNLSDGLTHKDPGKKYLMIDDFVDSVSRYIESGQLHYEHPIEIRSGESIVEMSKRNLQREMGSLVELNRSEKIVYEKALGLPFRFFFRMSPWGLLRILQDQAILSTHLVKVLKNKQVKPYTPAVEEKLYGAFNYIFGSVGFWTGYDDYGKVIVEIDPAVIEKRGWFTRRSGWRVINKERAAAGITGNTNYLEPSIEEKARKAYVNMSFSGEDYQKAIALRLISNLRKMNPAVLESFVKADEKKMIKLMKKHRIGFLEGKILGSMNLCDIDQVSLPELEDQKLEKNIRKLGMKTGVRINSLKMANEKVLPESGDCLEFRCADIFRQ